MKTYTLTLLVCCTLIAGCSPMEKQSTKTPMEERPTETVTSPPPLEPSPTATLEVIQPQAIQLDQETLQDAWQTPIKNVILVFTACEYMYETHSNFQQGEIDLEEAKFEFDLESDLLSFTRWDTPEPYEYETTAEYMWRVEVEMRTLIEWYDSIDEEMIGSAEALDGLSPTCLSLRELQREVIDAGMDAGLTAEWLDEIDPLRSEMFTDIHNMIRE